MIGKFLKRSIGAATIGGVGFASYKINTDEGSQRSWTFWKQVFPIYAHYRYYQLLNRDLGIMNDEEADKHFNELHEKYTDQVKQLTYRMRGFYLKQAQLMSIQDDFIPPAYMRWVKDTQDNVPSEFQGDEARHYCAKILKDELKLNFDDVFSEWDDKPLGVASIGQVHKAKLRSNGKTVAVKLLVPGIEPKFRADINTIRDFCRLAMPQHVTAFDEIEKQFCTEFDYYEEAKNLQEIYQVMMPQWQDYIEIPQPYLDFCSKHILVMEFLDGVKLVDGIRAKFSKLAALQGKTVETIETERKELLKKGLLRLKSIEESQVEQQQIQKWLFYSDLINPKNLWAAVNNYSPLRWWNGPMEYEWSEVPVDLGSCIELLCRVHANQIFAHGIFNGDPHPGNILLLKNGKLGLIDYGQVKRITLHHRNVYAKLILAHSRQDREEIIRIHFDELGTVTKYRDPEIAYLMSAFYNDRDDEEVRQGKNLAEFIDYLEAKDPMVLLPEDYLFISRVNLLLRGMGSAFGIRLRMSKMWESEAKKHLESQKIDY